MVLVSALVVLTRSVCHVSLVDLGLVIFLVSDIVEFGAFLGLFFFAHVFCLRSAILELAAHGVGAGLGMDIFGIFVGALIVASSKGASLVFLLIPCVVFVVVLVGELGLWRWVLQHFQLDLDFLSDVCVLCELFDVEEIPSVELELHIARCDPYEVDFFPLVFFLIVFFLDLLLHERVFFDLLGLLAFLIEL